ncbi:U9-ctenitoxin-Pr1a-like [Haliotis rubra]|uniref:U9-ctenitoxin-Pr1a-like n=1 Tax=Haliotis rubra TaxID=36100 RepID=UPI001EE51381|nr:U9-ctenitoxin-Pr1a-like [Haliotis rubra]
MLPFALLCVVLTAWVEGVPTGCHTGAECGDRQCCVGVNTVSSRRGAAAPGVCVDMGVESGRCHLASGYAWHKPQGLVKLCPCRTGLICGPINSYDEFGQKGICSIG